jgi:predicted RNase H-like HicB family nuclease
MTYYLGDLIIETEQEEDGRWVAEVVNLPGVLTYGSTEADAVVAAENLARHVEAAHGKGSPK